MKKNIIILLASEKQKEQNQEFLSELNSNFDVATDLQKELWNKTEFLVLLGGDGSLNHLVNHFNLEVISKKKIIYFPTGTGNDFAKSLHVEPTLPSLRKLESIIQGEKVIEVPICKCNDKYFVNVMVAGAAALVTESGDTLLKKVMGKVTYFIGAIEQLLQTKSYKYSYSVEGFEKSVESAGFLVSQGLFAGGGIRVSPSYSANFGETFDFVSLKSDSVGEILSSTIELQKDEPNTDELELDFIKTQKVIIKGEQTIPTKLDGEVYEASEFTLEKSSKVLKFLLH